MDLSIKIELPRHRKVRLKDLKSRTVIKNILITGNPGVGKTTLIQNIISRLNVSAGGFYTVEVRDENGKRWGFKIISLDGREEVLASVDVISSRRVSKYGVDVGAVDSVGVTAIRDALKSKDVVVIDEIGRMELISDRFRDIVQVALDSPKPVLGTIALKETNTAKKIKERKDTRLIRLTRANFHEIETYIGRLMQKILDA
jgi:nucleoside-triphosphatase